MSNVGINRRDRMNAASHVRNLRAQARKREMRPAWWSCLFDAARGSGITAAPSTIAALVRRGYLSDDIGAPPVTHAGYFALMARRLDPIADRTDAEVVAYYLALRDAPAWPTEGT